MRTLLLVFPLLLFALAPSCDNQVTVLVQYGCDTEDLVVETSDGITTTEVARFAPGTAPACFLIGQSKVPILYSRCVSSAVGVPVPTGVFDPVQECN